MSSAGPYLRGLYLVRCYRQQKFLFFLSVVFIGAVLYGHKSTCEITPAIVPGMYTGAAQAKTDDLLVVTADDQLLDLHHTLDEPRRMMIFSTLAAFQHVAPYQGALLGNDVKSQAIQQLVTKHPFMKSLAVHALNSPDDYGRYLPWLMKYIQQAVDPKISRLGIYQLHMHYDENNLPVADYRKVLYELDASHIK